MEFSTIKKFASIPALAGLVMLFSITSSSAQRVIIENEPLDIGGPGVDIGVVRPPIIIDPPIIVDPPSFSFEFSGVEDQEGCAGETHSTTVDCVLVSEGNIRSGAQAFSFGVTAEGGTITDITTDGTDAARLFRGGFEVTQIIDAVLQEVQCIRAPCPPILVRPAGAICIMTQSFEQGSTLPATGTASLATLTIESTVERCSETRENLRNAEDALDDEVTGLTELQEHKGNLENQIDDLSARIDFIEGELTRRCRLNVRDVPLPLANAEGAGGGRGDVIGDIIAPFPCWPILVQNIELEGIAVDLVPAAEAGIGAGVLGGIDPIIGPGLPDLPCLQLQSELETAQADLAQLQAELEARTTAYNAANTDRNQAATARTAAQAAVNNADSARVAANKTLALRTNQYAAATNERLVAQANLEAAASRRRFSFK